jgi:hypothetical protein
VGALKIAKMSGVESLVHVVVRQATSTAAAAISTTPPPCVSDNTYDGGIGPRISAIFVILIGSLFGKTNSTLELHLEG